MLAGVGYQGRPLEPGQEYEVDDHFGALVVQDGRAHQVATPSDVVEVQEPDVRHRDPKVPRGPRGR